MKQNKHTEIRMHTVYTQVKRGHISVIHVPTTQQHADMLTKPLHGPALAAGRAQLGVRPHYATSNQAVKLRGCVEAVSSHCADVAQRTTPAYLQQPRRSTQRRSDPTRHKRAHLPVHCGAPPPVRAGGSSTGLKPPALRQLPLSISENQASSKAWTHSPLWRQVKIN